MAVTPATLSVTVTESITVDNEKYGASRAISIANISYVDHRTIVSILGAETGVVGFGAAAGKGTFIDGKVKYMRLTNRDSTNFVRIRFQVTGGDTFDIKLKAEESFIMFNQDINVSETAAAFAAFSTLDDIVLQADTAAVEVECFIAAEA